MSYAIASENIIKAGARRRVADDLDAFHRAGFQLLKHRGSFYDAARTASDDRLPAASLLLLKAGVGAMTMTSDSALASVDGAVRAFIGSLRSVGAFDAMVPAMKQAPIRTRAAVITAGASGSAVAEMSLKQLSSLALSGSILEEVKAVAVVAMSNELIRFAGDEGAALFSSELQAAVAAQTDVSAYATLSAAVQSPITSGFGTSAGFRHDLAAALASMEIGQLSRLFMWMPPAMIATLASMGSTTGEPAFPDLTLSPLGGTISGIPVLPSDAVPAGSWLLADAAGCVAAPGSVELRTSPQGTLQMDTAPDSPETASTILISLYQQGMTSIAAERYFSLQVLRPNAVALVQNAAYVGNSPA